MKFVTLRSFYELQSSPRKLYRHGKFQTTKIYWNSIFLRGKSLSLIETSASLREKFTLKINSGVWSLKFTPHLLRDKVHRNGKFALNFTAEKFSLKFACLEKSVLRVKRLSERWNLNCSVKLSADRAKVLVTVESFRFVFYFHSDIFYNWKLQFEVRIHRGKSLKSSVRGSKFLRRNIVTTNKVSHFYLSVTRIWRACRI